MFVNLLNRGYATSAENTPVALLKIQAFNAFVLGVILINAYYVYLQIIQPQAWQNWPVYYVTFQITMHTLVYLGAAKINHSRHEDLIKTLVFANTLGVILLFSWFTGLYSDFIFYYTPTFIAFYGSVTSKEWVKYFSIICFTSLVVFGFLCPNTGVILPVPAHNFLTEVLLSVLCCLIFIFQKYKIIDQHHQNMIAESTKNQSLQANYEQVQQEVLLLAQDNSPAFVYRFSEVYFGFFSQIKTNITPSEKKLCAMIKLGFESPQIADICSLSLRTVQTKKYNLKQKLQLGSHESLTQYIQSL